MEFEAILHEFGLKTGAGVLAPDENDSVSLLFDNEHEITFLLNKKDGAVLFYSEVGDSRTLDREGCMRLLTASLLGAQTGGAALAVHDRLDKVVLWKRYDDSFEDCTDLEKAINAFLAQIVHWKNQLMAPAPASPDAVPPPPPPFGPGISV